MNLSRILIMRYLYCVRLTFCYCAGYHLDGARGYFYLRSFLCKEIKYVSHKERRYRGNSLLCRWQNWNQDNLLPENHMNTT